MIDFTTLEIPHSSPPTSDLLVVDDGEILTVGPEFTNTRPFDGVTFGKFPKQSPTTFVADDKEILLVGPDYTGTSPSNGGTFPEFPETLHATPPASDATVEHDGEVLLVGPNFSGTSFFLGDGKFGGFTSVRDFRSTTNPFLADILASSSGTEAALSNGFGLTADGQHGHTVEDEFLPFGRHDPGTGRSLSPSHNQSDISYSSQHSPRGALLRDVMDELPGVFVTRSPVMYETSFSEQMSPVSIVVS